MNEGEKYLAFPKNFIWGTATAGHQVEGNNTKSDWWAWEHRDQALRAKEPAWLKIWPRESSDIACDSYNRYEEDFDLCIDANNNAVRIGIEWARLQPNKDTYDQKEFEHYKKVLRAAKNRGLKTYVTLWHFSIPQWLAEMGGWLNATTPELFAQYSKKCAENLDGLIDAYLTINEPQVYALQGYTVGLWPPNKRNYLYSLICQINTMRGHNKAYHAIKEISQKPVGIVKNIVHYQNSANNYLTKNIDVLVAKFLNWLNCEFYLDNVIKCCDILGFNYYFTNEIRDIRIKNPNDITNDLGWWVNPEGIYHVLKRLQKYKVPIYITESGCADNNDNIRISLIRQTLIYIHKAISEGVNVRGYFHWSLIDNFEWHHGFWPRFGLIEIDRNNNLERKPRKSFYYYADICKINKIPIDLEYAANSQ